MVGMIVGGCLLFRGCMCEGKPSVGRIGLHSRCKCLGKPSVGRIGLHDIFDDAMGIACLPEKVPQVGPNTARGRGLFLKGVVKIKISILLGWVLGRLLGQQGGGQGLGGH